MMMNIKNVDELFRQIRRASSIKNFMHMTQTKLFYSEIHIQHIKTIKFQETNMRSRAKIFNEPNCFVLTNLKFFLKLFVQTRVLVLLLYVPSQQLWSLRDGQFT